MRHGETTCNAQSVIQGPRVDSELSQAGLSQAESLAAAFRETRLDALFVSPLRRARQTAEALNMSRAGPLALQVVPELYELDYGDFCGRTLDDVREAVASIFDAWAMGRTTEAFPGGESPVLAQHRVRRFAQRMQERAEHDDVAVVAHGRINRILVATWTGTSLAEQARFPQDNANITHLSVDQDGVMLRRINDTSHLQQSGPSFN